MGAMFLDSLNEEQKAAVTTTEGFVRVIAGAGSGKTRALTYRFAYLVNEIGILPSHILCVTFTNKAANEMRSRIRKLTGDNDTGYISTFHGFCVSVLKEDSNAVNFPKSFLVLDNSDINAMLQIVYEERGLTLREKTFSDARDMIEMKKLKEKPRYYEELIRMSLDSLHQKYLAAESADDMIFYGYLYQQKKCFGLDYNDLIKFTLSIFSENDGIRTKWQRRLEYIMIDEFQDIDAIQYELMTVLCGWHGNLFVVGDPDQTIYTWRGADVRFLLDFDRKFPGVKTLFMLKNYRSSPQIVRTANSLIGRNRNRIAKNLVPVFQEDSDPDFCRTVYFHAASADEEAEFIADECKKLTDGGRKPCDIAVLFRAHYLTRAVEEVFRRKKLEYTLFSGLPFFERREIRDSLGYLRMIAYKDDLSFLRTVNEPKRNIGERRIAFLKEFAERNGCSLYDALKANYDGSLFENTGVQNFIKLVEEYSSSYQNMQISELFAHVMNDSGYERALRTEGSQERLDNLAELKQAIYEYEVSCGEECNLENFLSHIALYSNSDLGSTKDAVKFMTVHAAKGLEFPFVFVAGLNENIFPSKKVDSQENMEEERRLAFVAFTRAEKKLFLTEAEGFSEGFGFRFPSRFIFDIDRSLLDFKVELSDSLVQKSRNYIEGFDKNLEKLSSMKGIRTGGRVVHSILGEGTVIEIDEQKKTYLIKFDGIPTARKMSFKAPLRTCGNERRSGEQTV